jgi:hypothetical protein
VGDAAAVYLGGMMVRPLKQKERRACRECGELFVVYRSTHIFCCDEHQLAHYNRTHDIPGKMKAMRERRKKEEKR